MSERHCSERRCPNCASPLTEVPMAGQRVDRCRSCAGIFFDAGELESILKIVRLFNKVTLDEPDLPAPPEEQRREMICPHDGEPMRPVESGVVVFDSCPRCEGIWLDSGEITALKLAEANIRENMNLYIRLGN